MGHAVSESKTLATQRQRTDDLPRSGKDKPIALVQPGLPIQMTFRGEGGINLIRRNVIPVFTGTNQCCFFADSECAQTAVVHAESSVSTMTACPEPTGTHLKDPSATLMTNPLRDDWVMHHSSRPSNFVDPFRDDWNFGSDCKGREGDTL